MLSVYLCHVRAKREREREEGVMMREGGTVAPLLRTQEYLRTSIESSPSLLDWRVESSTVTLIMVDYGGGAGGRRKIRGRG